MNDCAPYQSMIGPERIVCMSPNSLKLSSSQLSMALTEPSVCGFGNARIYSSMDTRRGSPSNACVLNQLDTRFVTDGAGASVLVLRQKAMNVLLAEPTAARRHDFSERAA